MWRRTIYWVAANCRELLSPPSTITQITQCVPHKLWYLATKLHGATSPKTKVPPRVPHMSPSVSYCDRKILQGRSVCDRQNKFENYGLGSLQRTLKPVHDISLWEQGYKRLYSCKVFCEGSASLKTLDLRGLIFRKFHNANGRKNAKCWCFKNLSWKIVLT